MGRRRDPGRWAALGLFLLASMALYFPVVAGREIFSPGDFTFHYLFFNDYLLRQFTAFHLPVWNLYNFSGQPFLADPQASAYYPIKDLLLFLSLPWRSLSAEMYALEINSILHLALAGWFTFLFVRDLLRSWEAGMIAGLTFAFSGFLAGYPVLQQTILQSCVWLPAVLWLLLLAFERGMGWKYWISASVVYAVAFLAGHPQMFWMESYVILAWIALLWARHRVRFGTFAGRVALFYLLVIALSAPQLLPTLEFTRHSARIHSTYAELSGGLPLRDGWQVVFSSLFTKFSPLYAGVAALGLWFVSLGWLFGKKDESDRWMASLVLFWSIVLSFFLLLSFGGNAFLYGFVYRFLPGGNLFRDQERAAFVVAFSFGVISGLGFHLLSRKRRRARVPSVAFVAFSLATLAAMMLVYRVPVQFLYLNHALLLKVTKLFLGGALLIVIAWKGASRKSAVVVLFLFVLADLFSVNYGLVVEKRSPADWNPIAGPMEVLRVEAGKGRLSVSGRVHNEYQLPGNYGMPIGVEDTLGGSSLRVGRYYALFKAMPLGRFWQITGVEYVVTWRKALFFPSELLGTFSMLGGKRALFYRLKKPFPKARLVRSVKCASDEAALKAMASFSLDFDKTAIVPPDDCRLVRSTILDGEGGSGGVDGMVEEETGRTVVSIRGSGGGLLVVSQNWMPGWHAYVIDESGRKRDAKVVRADYTFLGVILPPDAEKVVLRYLPRSVLLGLAIGGGAWLGVLAFLFSGYLEKLWALKG